MSKGSQRRRCQLTRQAEDLQYALAYGQVTFTEYEKKKKKLESEDKWWKR